MRRLMLAANPNVTAVPPPLFSPLNGQAMFIYPTTPILISVADFAIVSLVLGLVLLSVVSLFFIFHLRFKSRRAHHLQNFNVLWTVRLLLVSFVIIWAVNEVLRLPFFRRRYLYPFLPSLTLSQQAKMCKIHVVLSLGFSEPGFLITLLFLIHLSVKQRAPCDNWAIPLIFLCCLPVLILQTFFIFFTPFVEQVPGFLRRSSVLARDGFDHRTRLCSYPLLSTMVFGAFGAVYTIVWLLSCWRVVSFVINKGTRLRIHVLALSVITTLPLQVLFLSLSSFWMPGTVAYSCVMMGGFVSVACSAAAAQGILVIKPIVDALSCGGDCCRWSAGNGG